ncbi:hypothetical protein ONJ17_26780, partial [Salmonella enterica subsp. enterica serovar Agona]|nr:hypothetical protein [Salmonella enterica subsp. enterica serovar Agona]
MINVLIVDDDAMVAELNRRYVAQISGFHCWRVGHHLLGRFEGGFSYSHHQIADAAAAEGNLFNQANQLQRDL